MQRRKFIKNAAHCSGVLTGSAISTAEKPQLWISTLHDYILDYQGRLKLVL
jgi:hypothetical protein